MTIRNITLVLFTWIIGACAGTPQPPVSMDLSGLANSPNGVAFAFQPVPEPVLLLPGADCLLCLAVASTANSALSGVVKAYSTSDIEDMKSELVEILESAGKSVTLLDTVVLKDLPKFKSETPGFARRDMRGIAADNGAGHVFLVDFTHIGVVRPYASYIPTGAPYASIAGVAYLVDASDNSYTWYDPISIQLQAEEDWKEEPDYHNLTNAYYRAIETLRDRLTNVFEAPAQPLEPTDVADGDTPNVSASLD